MCKIFFFFFWVKRVNQKLRAASVMNLKFLTDCTFMKSLFFFKFNNNFIWKCEEKNIDENLGNSRLITINKNYITYRRRVLPYLPTLTNIMCEFIDSIIIYKKKINHHNTTDDQQVSNNFFWSRHLSYRGSFFPLV